MRRKLGPQWHDQPLRVSAKHGLNAYRLVVPKAWRMNPVVNVSKLKPAGAFRPTVAADTGDTAEAALPLGVITRMLVHREPGPAATYRLKVKASGAARALLASSARDRGGFPPLRDFVQSARWVPLHDHLGRLVMKQFVDPDSPGDEMRRYQGLVVSFDPADVDQQFEVLYEDGDSEWLPERALRALLLPMDGVAADEAKLTALAAETRAAWAFSLE